MNSKLLLVHGITLLYRESQLTEKHENSSLLVKKIIDNIKLPEVTIGMDREREILEGLKSTAIEMCHNPTDHIYEASEVMQRLKVNIMDDDSLYNALHDGMALVLSENGLKRTVLNLRATINNFFNWEEATAAITTAYQQARFKRSSLTSLSQFIDSVITSLEPYKQQRLQRDPAIISEVFVHDTVAVHNIMRDAMDQYVGTGIIKTGWQAVNRMLDGGFRRGEEWVIGALQHKYKTGLSLSLFKHFCIYNVPVLKNPNKKACHVRFSFEDKLALNFLFLYKSLKENETGLEVVVKTKDELNKMTKDELDAYIAPMAAYVQEKLGVTGYHAIFAHINPSKWTIADLMNKIIEIEADGYEVHSCMVDYLIKLPTTGCRGVNPGEDILNMYEQLGNFFAQRNILFITPHQLSTEAKQLVRDGRSDFVKELPGRGYYMKCKQIDQVVDGELFIHIEKVNNESYLTIQRGKHRKDQVQKTPDQFLYTVYQFQNIGGILDDINGVDLSRKKPGGGPLGSADEIPFWERETI